MAQATRIGRARLFAGLAVVAVALAAGVGIAACALAGGEKPRSAPPKPVARIGAMNFAEQSVLVELYAQALESAGYAVERRPSAGAREAVFPSLEAGDIDLYPEYLASALAYASGGTARATSDPEVTRAALAAALAPRGIEVLDHAPAADTNGFVVTEATARRYGLSSLSDLARHRNLFTLGGPPECPRRLYCQAGLETVYGILFKDFKPLDTSGLETVAALDGRHIDVGLLFTTDPRILSKGLVLLRDDRGLQVAENVAPIIRAAFLQDAAPATVAALNAVSARLTTDDLMLLNKQVVLDRKDPHAVVAAWLGSTGR